MYQIPHRRRLPRTLRVAGSAAFVLAVLCVPSAIYAQAAPATTATATADQKPAEPKQPEISPRKRQAADDAYLAGARKLSKGDPVAAERDFAHALLLDPTKPEYAQALAQAKQVHVSLLVQQAARDRLRGHIAAADKAFAEAKRLDPDNLIVTQHLDPGPLTADAPGTKPASDEIARLGGPIHVKPTPGVHSFHRRGNVQNIARDVFKAYGITVTFDTSVNSQTIWFDMDDVNYATATRVLLHMVHVFATPLDAHSVLLAKDTKENRDRLVQQVEETFYLPGLAPEQLTEMSNIAKNIFDLKQVAVQPSGYRIVVRGNEDAVNLVSGMYAEMLDGAAETMLDVHIYEVDATHIRKIGTQLPTSGGIFSITAEAQSLISSNQSLIQQAIASGLLVLNGSPLENLIKELGFLAASGLVNVSQYSNLLGTFGGGLTYAGLFLGSGASFDFLLTSTDVRSLDDIQMRVSDNQQGVFRAGSRYPVITSTYSSSIPSSVSSALAGVNVNGSSAASLLAQLSSQQSIPQFQYEDLGVTLKATPQVQKSGQVHVKLDLKIEALGAGSINSIPVLTNRQLISDITVPEGQTVLIANEVSKNELRSATGIPGLNEIPGFQAADKSVELDSGELLITITPHIVRKRSSLVASRRLVANQGTNDE